MKKERKKRKGQSARKQTGQDKVKYLNYLAGIARRCRNEKKECPILRMIVIYTGDIERKQVSAEYDIGAIKMKLEPAFLSELDSEGMFRHLKEKVGKNELLDDEELMKFIILPLSYRTKEEKEEKIEEAINLAGQVQDRDQQIFVLAGILVFSDKVIDGNQADKIRRMIGMTKVAMIFEREKQEAVAKVEKEKLAALDEAKEWKLKVEKEKQRAEEISREFIIKMLQGNYSTEEIAFISSSSPDKIEAIRQGMSQQNEK